MTIDQKPDVNGFADGTREQSSYQLIAYNDLSIAKSNPLTIRLVGSVVKRRKPARPKLFAIGAIFIGLAAFFIYKMSSPKNYEFRVDAVRLYEDSDFTIHGKSLPDRNGLFVFFNDKAGDIKDYSADSLVARVPKLEDTTEGSSVRLFVLDGKKTIFSTPYAVRSQTINLFDSASKAKWRTGLNLPGGDGIDPNHNVIQTNWPGSESEEKGSAKTGSFTIENSKYYSVLRTHPWWYPGGTVRGSFPWCSLEGKKYLKRRPALSKTW